VLESDDGIKINRASREPPAWFTIAWAEQSVLDQKVRANQQSISGKRRKA
jgi:hypothetical protein